MTLQQNSTVMEKLDQVSRISDIATDAAGAHLLKVVEALLFEIFLLEFKPIPNRSNQELTLWAAINCLWRKKLISTAMKDYFHTLRIFGNPCKHSWYQPSDSELQQIFNDLAGQLDSIPDKFFILCKFCHAANCINTNFRYHNCPGENSTLCSNCLKADLTIKSTADFRRLSIDRDSLAPVFPKPPSLPPTEPDVPREASPQQLASLIDDWKKFKVA